MACTRLLRQYKVAKERCDILAGAPKDTCQNDAKVKFGMK